MAESSKYPPGLRKFYIVYTNDVALKLKNSSVMSPFKFRKKVMSSGRSARKSWPARVSGAQITRKHRKPP